ncbi:MAG: lactate dehydrogenase-like 2-hydroxyacid dehydrogenase [Flavobacterium sp.]|jgi:lactate dehydrogenase-like 2-hydroxyacid dehydrogenase
MENTSPKVLVTRKLPAMVENRLRSTYDVSLNTTDQAMSKAALSAAMSKFDALVSTVSDPLDAKVLQSSNRRVQFIANVGVGYSNIDTKTACDEGIGVSNTPDVLTDATADIALLLILSATRRAYAAELKLREGRWEGFSLIEGLGSSMQGKVIGIIGMGRIGQATARRAIFALGMKVVFYNRSPIAGLDFEATRLGTIDELMALADVVSIHVPGSGSSPTVNANHIALLKPTSYLINTARGDSIDQAALIAALTEGRIAGAGLDVYVNEPDVPDELLMLDNVTLLPHIGSATEEVRTAMGMVAVNNLDAFFSNSPLPNKVV